MAQKMTEENKPFVMATLSGIAYKGPEEAKKTFEHFRFFCISSITASLDCIATSIFALLDLNVAILVIMSL